MNKQFIFKGQSKLTTKKTIKILHIYFTQKIKRKDIGTTVKSAVPYSIGK